MNSDTNPRIAIVGAGIFGVTTALMLAKKGYKVAVFEKTNDIFNGASGINQYRLHSGYHYPRAISTATDCRDSVQYFCKEYELS